MTMLQSKVSFDMAPIQQPGAWQPIKTAPELSAVLIGCKGWLPVIAMRHKKRWGECLSGEYHGTKPPFEPTHWKLLESVPE